MWVHSLNECGYNGNLLQAKLEKQREEDAPFTQPHSKERIEMLRKASTHGKKFLATRGSHVMSPTKWNQLVELRKRKYGEEGVTAAAEEVVGVADEVFGATEGV